VIRRIAKEGFEADLDELIFSFDLAWVLGVNLRPTF
jgi:hypothetical protein